MWRKTWVMNWLFEFFILIIVGVAGMFAIRIPLMMFSPFQGDTVSNMYFQMLVSFAVFAVFLFQAGRVVRKEPFCTVQENLYTNTRRR